MATKQPSFANDGAPVPRLQRVQGTTEQRGTPVPGIQKVPTPQPSNAGQSSGGGNSNPSNGSQGSGGKSS